MITAIIIISIFRINIIDNYYSNLNTIFFDSINNSQIYNLSITKYFNYPNRFYIFILIIYLLITLIAIVKITKVSLGPLRQTH